MTTIHELEKQLKAAKAQQEQIVRAKYPTGVVVDLRSPQGNVYCLIGLCNNLMRQLDFDETEKNKFRSELVGKDYSGHLKVMENWFGLVFVNKPEERQ